MNNENDPWNLRIMGTYAHVRNYTKGEDSFSEFKYGRAKLDELIRDNPGWSNDDIIIGGGSGSDYFLINGWDRYMIINQRNDDGVSHGYDIEPIDTNIPLQQCSCGTLLQFSTAIAQKTDCGYYFPIDDEMQHCSYCHWIWDGNAQCQCQS